MKRSMTFATCALLTIALGTLSASPAFASTASAAAAQHVKVSLTEMTIKLDVATVTAGTVVFDVSNIGTTVHELVVLRTDTPDNAIPARTSNASKADEAGDIAEAEDIDPGKTATLTLSLTPGNYVLLCNEAGHYMAGMHAAFTVASSIATTEKEMSISLGQKVMAAGPVTFSVTNSGTVTHELVVLQTSLAEGAIPARANDPSKADETGDLGEVEDLAPGATGTVTLTLPAGSYVIICNEAGHYAAGMHTSFTVLPTLSRTTSAAIDREESRSGIDPLTDAARVNLAALLTAPGVKVSALDRAAIAAGITPRADTSDGSLMY